ncbi:MAG: hypothetical protein DBY10_00270 [Clostridiales bacterium]|jgi:putative membrane protein|nr:MAG: hypothetical protein DBY10_00270 [Clostridiales bacterium]
MKKRILALATACGMLISTLAGCGSGADSSTGSEASSAQNTGTDAVTTAAEQLLGHSDTDGKEETVYVIADANGKPDQVIVSEWLKNGDGKDTLKDVSNLENIQNVKGDQDYTRGSGDQLTWNAKGSDIYYQGASTAQLPVDVTVSYRLNGKAVSAEQLDGASGKLSIQFDYKNNTAKTRKIDGEQVTLYQPFLMVSGLLLDNGTASNVEVTNGKVINSGDSTVVVGIAMPGLSESLGLKGLKDGDGKAIDLDIPEHVTITADVKDFSLLTTVTVAENSALEELNLDEVDSVDDLKDALSDLGEASEKLVSGSQDLADGVGELNDKSGDLADGVNQLDDSAKKIAKGSDTLKDGADQVNSGASQIKKGAGDAASAAGKISDGSSQIASNMDTLANSVSGLPDSANQLLSGAKSLKTALGGKKSTGDTIYTGAEKIAAGAAQLSAGLKNSDGTSIYEAAAGIKAGAEQIQSGAQSISGGLQSAASNLDTSKGYINDAIGQLEQLSKAEGVSDEVKQTYAAIIQELKASLQYQDGVSSALTSTGEGTLQGGLSSIESGAQTIAAYAGKVADGSAELAAGADQIAAGAQAIESGIDTMVSGNNGSNLNALIQGLNQLSEQSGALVAGVNQLDDASNTLSDSMGQLADGTSDLADGAGSLADGTANLADGADSLSGYLGQLSDGTGQLSEGTGALIDGIGQLLDGSNDLADGMAEFDEEGIQKLTSLMDGDLTGIVDRLEAIQDYAKEYQSYGGNARDMDCSTKFIYKTDSIGK